MLNQDAAQTADQQKYLENNILKLNYKSFTQIVILGSAGFTPFMQLSAQNRREVIEDLLDIRIFSSMNSIIKDKIRQNREDVKLLSLKKDNLSDKVDMQKGFIDHLEMEANQEIIKKTLKVDELKVNITQIEDHTKTLTRVENGQRSKMEELSFDKTKIKKLGGLRGKITQKVSTLTKELEFFESNTVCPTCTQSIEDEFRL